MAGEPVSELAKWWREYIEGDAQKRVQLVKGLPASGNKKRKKPKRRVRKESLPPEPSKGE
jgi:hypothetical protein